MSHYDDFGPRHTGEGGRGGRRGRDGGREGADTHTHILKKEEEEEEWVGGGDVTLVSAHRGHSLYFLQQSFPDVQEEISGPHS